MSLENAKNLDTEGLRLSVISQLNNQKNLPFMFFKFSTFNNYFIIYIYKRLISCHTWKHL